MKKVVNGVSRYNLYINGEWISTSGEMIEVENPATEEAFATVADATEDEVKRLPVLRRSLNRPGHSYPPCSAGSGSRSSPMV